MVAAARLRRAAPIEVQVAHTEFAGRALEVARTATEHRARKRILTVHRQPQSLVKRARLHHGQHGPKSSFRHNAWSIRDFQDLWRDIEKIKLQPAVRRIEQAITDLAEVKQQDAGAYQRLAAGLRSILED